MVVPDSPTSTIIMEKETKVIGEPLAEGNYTIMACDIDTTGKRLIDEIVQIATYSPKQSFSQYIMPLMNLNPAARQRHQIRVVTVGFFRMLKSMQTYKVIKTKTEVAALQDFLSYLEKLKEMDKSEGIILLFHEQRKLVPYMLIEAMKKYEMLPRFLNVVKSFVNTYTIAVDKCGNSMKYFSLKQVGRALLNIDDSSENKELFEGNASIRAKLVYEIAEHLARGGESGSETTADEPPVKDEDLTEKLQTLAYSSAASISSLEIVELQEQEEILQRQSSLRPIFLQYFKATVYHRIRAVNYRRVLAEHGQDLDELQKLWTELKKDGLTERLADYKELKEQDRNELLEILDHHFDPEKEAVKPNVRRSNRRRSRSRGNGNVHNNNHHNGNMNNNTIHLNKEKMAQAAGATANGTPKSPRKFFRNNRNRFNRRTATAGGRDNN